jgi:hypothetical protein
MLGDYLADLATRTITEHGSATTINGQATKAFWAEAQPGRIQMFLAENEWGTPAFDVEFPATVLRAPYHLANGSEVVRVAHNWRGVVRKIDAPDLEDAANTVKALVVLVPG